MTSFPAKVGVRNEIYVFASYSACLNDSLKITAQLFGIEIIEKKVYFYFVFQLRYSLFFSFYSKCTSCDLWIWFEWGNPFVLIVFNVQIACFSKQYALLPIVSLRQMCTTQDKIIDALIKHPQLSTLQLKSHHWLASSFVKYTDALCSTLCGPLCCFLCCHSNWIIPR